MRKTTFVIFAGAMLTAIMLLSACSNQSEAAFPENSTGETGTGDANTSLSDTDDSIYTDSLLSTYYLDEDEPAYSYLQNNSIQKFFAMWLDEYMDEETEAQWDYATLAPVLLLDHDFNSILDADTQLYTCVFTTANDETGYIIVSYSEDGPSIQQWSLSETTPYQYDLKANMEPIVRALRETDIDLSTATATRVEWIDTDKNRGDRIILFEDGKGDRYVCYLRDDDFSLEKQ